MDELSDIQLKVSRETLPGFFFILQHRFMVKVQVGCSVLSLLCDQLGIDPDYLDKRIQTLFLNGQPVDDVTRALVRDEDVLALSAAMPGLLGAILRKGSYYSPMRKEISHQGDQNTSGLREGKVVMKLFNVVTRELGPGFLERGIWVKGGDLSDFLRDRYDELLPKVREVVLGGRTVDPQEMKDVQFPDQWIALKVISQ